MSNRLFLPLLSGSSRTHPTVTAIRTKLGGRAVSEPGLGEIVSFEPAPGMALVGVVVFVEGEDAHVLVDGGTVRRAKRAALSSVNDAGEELVALSRAVRAFEMLSEGDSVRYSDSAGALLPGTLVEKCRYGALIARPDNVVMGIGFRNLYPDDSPE